MKKMSEYNNVVVLFVLCVVCKLAGRSNVICQAKAETQGNETYNYDSF